MKSSTLVAHVPEPVADAVKRKARQRHISVSRYITRLLEKDTETEIVYSSEELDTEISQSLNGKNVRTFSSGEGFLKSLKMTDDELGNSRNK